VKTLVVIDNEGMGHGDPELGRKILRTFLTKAGAAFDDLEAVVFFNAGVRCLTRELDMLQPLANLDHDGVDLIACGTCVDAYGLRERIEVGTIGSMDQILAEMNRADKVITL
jgi:sulfur relay (sulfurtransferase) complex TusBCD TusD component (DsrE family)